MSQQDWHPLLEQHIDFLSSRVFLYFCVLVADTNWMRYQQFLLRRRLTKIERVMRKKIFYISEKKQNMPQEFLPVCHRLQQTRAQCSSVTMGS